MRDGPGDGSALRSNGWQLLLRVDRGVARTTTMNDNVSEAMTGLATFPILLRGSDCSANSDVQSVSRYDNERIGVAARHRRCETASIRDQCRWVVGTREGIAVVSYNATRRRVQVVTDVLTHVRGGKMCRIRSCE
jgi:hypothetical protein